MIADDTKAIDAVVNADKKRLALIEERQRLEAHKGKQGEHLGERLKEVLFTVHMISSHTVISFKKVYCKVSLSGKLVAYFTEHRC